MHWPEKIDTSEMLTKETPSNTFLMVRFKCCFSMNIVTVIQFVLKVFFSFSLSTVGTDHKKTYGVGAGEGWRSTQKNICAREN